LPEGPPPAVGRHDRQLAHANARHGTEEHPLGGIGHHGKLEGAPEEAGGHRVAAPWEWNFAPRRQSRKACQWSMPIVFSVTSGYRTSIRRRARSVSGRRVATTDACSTGTPFSVSSMTIRTWSRRSWTRTVYAASRLMNGL